MEWLINKAFLTPSVEQLLRLKAKAEHQRLLDGFHSFFSFPTLPTKLASSCLLSENRYIIFDSWAD